MSHHDRSNAYLVICVHDCVYVAARSRHFILVQLSRAIVHTSNTRLMAKRFQVSMTQDAMALSAIWLGVHGGKLPR